MVACFGCVCSRMKQPDFQCFRERMGVARSLETMEEITGEMKALLLVGTLFGCDILSQYINTFSAQ